MQQALGVSSKDRVTTSVLTLDVEAEEVGKNRLRAAVVAGAGGLVMTLVAATLWDARRLRRPRRRKATRVIPDSDPVVKDPDPVASAPVETTEHPDEVTAAAPVSPLRALDKLDNDTAGTPVSPVSPLRALDKLDDDTAGTPVSPVSPLRAQEPLEEAADAPDNAPR
jgi:hypothetical protein